MFFYVLVCFFCFYTAGKQILLWYVYVFFPLLNTGTNGLGIFLTKKKKKILCFLMSANFCSKYTVSRLVKIGSDFGFFPVLYKYKYIQHVLQFIFVEGILNFGLLRPLFPIVCHLVRQENLFFLLLLY